MSGRKSLRASAIPVSKTWRYISLARVFRIVEVSERFSFDAKSEADRDNPKVQEWERLMWKFQRPLPQAKPGEKWIPMERIFKLDAAKTSTSGSGIRSNLP